MRLFHGSRFRMGTFNRQNNPQRELQQTCGSLLIELRAIEIMTHRHQWRSRNEGESARFETTFKLISLSPLLDRWHKAADAPTQMPDAAEGGLTVAQY